MHLGQLELPALGFVRPVLALGPLGHVPGAHVPDSALENVLPLTILTRLKGPKHHNVGETVQHLAKKKISHTLKERSKYIELFIVTAGEEILFHE